jgi:RNA exonuclease 1
LNDKLTHNFFFSHKAQYSQTFNGWQGFNGSQQWIVKREEQKKWLERLEESKIVEALTPYILTSQQMYDYGYPVKAPNSSQYATINYTPYPTAQQPAGEPNFQQARCARCSKLFVIFSDVNPCTYHWGKLWNKTPNDTSKYWTCCYGTEHANGCATARLHVWTGLRPGLNGPFGSFVCTKPNNTRKTLPIAALDCEMCFTRAGLEVVKVTVVDKYGTVVYEKLIKPSNNIVDYNTKFSGITKKDMQEVTDNLQIVQRDLLEFISAETILIGHGLESDLRVLRLLHKKVIDTSIVYPHHNGFPYRNSLKNLAKRVLKRFIQETTHDPAEDARTAMDLMMAKISLDKIKSSTSRTV